MGLFAGASRNRLQPLSVDEPDERGEGGGAEVEVASVHLVEVVGSGVVDVEIALRVGRQAADRRALEHKRGDVRPATALRESVNPIRFEERPPPRGALVSVARCAPRGRIGAAEIRRCRFRARARVFRRQLGRAPRISQRRRARSPLRGEEHAAQLTRRMKPPSDAQRLAERQRHPAPRWAACVGEHLLSFI